MQPVNLLEEEWEFLTDLLPEDWRDQARTTGALRRARVVGSADCLLKLILMHTATGLSLRQTVVRAREQVLLSSSPPQVRLKLQVLRIGELGIAAIPCEVFTEIGLEFKKQSPLKPMFTRSTTIIETAGVTESPAPRRQAPAAYIRTLNGSARLSTRM